MKDKDIQLIQLPVELFLQVAPMLIELLTNTIFRIDEVARVQQNVAINDILDEHIQISHDLLKSVFDANNDMGGNNNDSDPERN